jgi:hypothetical protein
MADNNYPFPNDNDYAPKELEDRWHLPPPSDIALAAVRHPLFNMLLWKLGTLAGTGGPLGLAASLPLIESSAYGDASATDKIMAKQGAGNTPNARAGKAFDTFRYYPGATQAASEPQAARMTQAALEHQDAVVPQATQPAPPPWWLEHVAAGLDKPAQAGASGIIEQFMRNNAGTASNGNR